MDSALSGCGRQQSSWSWYGRRAQLCRSEMSSQQRCSILQLLFALLPKGYFHSSLAKDCSDWLHFTDFPTHTHKHAQQNSPVGIKKDKPHVVGLLRFDPDSACTPRPSNLQASRFPLTCTGVLKNTVWKNWNICIFSGNRVKSFFKDLCSKAIDTNVDNFWKLSPMAENRCMPHFLSPLCVCVRECVCFLFLFSPLIMRLLLSSVHFARSIRKTRFGCGICGIGALANQPWALWHSSCHWNALVANIHTHLQVYLL